MKQLAITLIELNNTEAPNIGTIVSETGSDEELRTKAIKAIESHFDADVISLTIQDGLDFESVRSSPPLDATVVIDNIGEEFEYQIELQQTWIY